MKRRKRNLLLPAAVQGIRTVFLAHVEAAGDLQRRWLAIGVERRWPGHSNVAARARTQWPGRAVKQPVQLTCGPSALFEFPMIFNHSNFEIQNGDLANVQKYLNFVGQWFETWGTTFIFGQTSNSLRIASYKFWNKFKIKSSLNF
jgi:hypothetical protein